MKNSAELKLGQSLYLDLMRFSMALAVMIGHATFHGYTGRGFLWPIDPFRHLQTAVMGFFVLSGFVIAYVANSREKDGITYAAARIARMHSVIIPALFITLIFDWLGQTINPDFYKTWDFPTPIKDNQIWRYVLSLIYLNNTWILPSMNPGTNGPFWTMTYEVMYYLMFGVFLYMRTRIKYLLLILIAIIAGPSIITYFPIWLAGVGAYYLQCHKQPTEKLATVLFIASLLSIVLLSSYGPNIILHLDGNSVPLYYSFGILFAINIYSVTGIETPMAVTLSRSQVFLRWLGMLTFALYLCHRPLLNFFSVFRLDAPATSLQKVWLFGCTFLIVIAAAYLGEALRARLRKLVFTMVSKTKSRN